MSGIPNEASPEVGEAAAEEVAAARRDLVTQLEDRSLTVEDLFQMSEAEGGGSSHRVVGHMHIRAALLALPTIGETKADVILAEVGLDGTRHLDTIGVDEQTLLTEAVAAHGG